MKNLFLFLLIFAISANGASYDKLEKITEQQNLLLETREIIYEEHKLRYKIQLQALKMNLDIVNQSWITSLLFYYKESEKNNTFLEDVK